MSESAVFGGAGGMAGNETRRPAATFTDMLRGLTLSVGRGQAQSRRGEDRASRAEIEGVTAVPTSAEARDSLDLPVVTPDLPGEAAVDTADQSDVPGLAGDVEDEAPIVRPYQWTRGRTKATVHLEMETLVSISERGLEDSALATLEHRTVASLCRHPHAVAEVAAKLSVPLGVVRVLLSDMAEQGLITVHQTVADDDMAAHLVLMERVLSGLRRL